MALYNNREVSVKGPTAMQALPETVRIAYGDGSEETVPVGRVQFTEEEKKNLIKSFPSRFENVSTIKDEDVNAVRAGVAPPSDPTYKEQAELKARQEKQAEELKKQQDAAQKNAEKSVNDAQKASTDKVQK